MSGSFMGDGFTRARSRHRAGLADHRHLGRDGAVAWPVRAEDQHPRMGRGDVRTAVLALLAEKPMHGYQIIREIEERSDGAWKPSPGSVYPTLQLLADEGLISAEESDGRKTYSLTDEGRGRGDADSEKPAPWETPGSAREHGRTGALPEGRHRPRAGGRAGRALREPGAGEAGRRRCSMRRVVSSTPSSPRTDRVPAAARRSGDAMTDAGNMRARYRRILRFAARYLVQTWWYELFLPRIGLARLAARSARGAAAAHRAALPRARRRSRRPDDQGRPVHVVAARRAAARDHEGARGPAGRGAAGAIRRDPRARRGGAGRAARARVRVRRPDARWPRHPSARRTARDCPRRMPPRPASRTSS